MTPRDVKALITEKWHVSRETLDRLDGLVAMIVDETQRQNLISRSTIETIWVRHILDSVQLLDHAPREGIWMDLGSGAGFPGLVIAMLRPQPMLLIESRKLRGAFLADAAAKFDLTNVTVHCKQVEKLPDQIVRVISARAFAALDMTLRLGTRFADQNTVWVLPKGRSAKEELAAARESWHGEFHVEQSITDAEAAIVVAHHVRPRGKR